ncbi:SGNH hydrolase-like domain-containing protein, acetyltransferase AlgX [Nonomuraea maritima]|uniref:SGNH hydrolase-like domain-containing protein, acetyltransferase AlgX n=1 Tax=Nonomuraea maritima TaxID=683260 RepID=A0A1G9KP99_9ACTN|nr:hypothetical protein [Nonomuraea maritima]SDL51205.1 SGNH hydrolase-like domain-containing protein, acetyltransferase AlgX [Nonomuraea maritima]
MSGSTTTHTAKPRMNRRKQITVAAAGVLFFFTPAAAHVLGERAVELENRPLPAFPDVSKGWETIPRLEAWGTARLPLRDDAIRGHVSLSRFMFSESPAYNTGAEPTYPRVIEGEDGWLYFGDDVLEACRPRWSVEETLARVERLARIVRASGRQFVFTIAPDKTTIYPDKLPQRFLGQSCLKSRKTEFWRALQSASLEGYIDLRRPLLNLQASMRQPIYWRTDSHWNHRAAALYGATIASHLQTDLLNETVLKHVGQEPRAGDLGPLMASPRQETADMWTLTRHGVSERSQDTHAAPLWIRTKNSSTKAPLFKPRTVLIGDSFTRNSLTWTTPYFADLTVLRSDSPARVGPGQTAELIKSADVVVFEMVERYWVGGHGEMLDETTLSALERHLMTTP